jgi:prevent-host-death family protein
MAAERTWQASDARVRFPELIDGAMAGVPQVVRRRNGAEVVLVSRAYFDATRPNLRDFLLASAGAGTDEEEDRLAAAIRSVRATGAMGVAPRNARK